MGKMNLLKAAYTGKVGETVGAKWKDKNTIRVRTVPANPNTQAQQTVRGGFAEMSKFVSLFADQIKTVSALNTRGMSVRNAIMKINKDMIAGGTLSPDALVISSGGLPTPGGANPTAAQATGAVTVPLTEVTGTNITDKCKLVVVVVAPSANQGFVQVEDNATASATVNTGITGTDSLYVYVYALDYRGSAKVASASRAHEVTPA